jgi:hypothetical protein
LEFFTRNFAESCVHFEKQSVEKAMMRKMLLLAGMGLGFASMAQASPIFTYSAQLAQGQTLTSTSTSATYNVYLVETDTSGSAAFVPSDGGLYSAAAALIENTGGQGVTVTAVTPNSTAEPAGFSGNDNKGSGTYGAYLLDITNNAASTLVAPTSTTTAGTTTTSDYLLGTVTFSLAANYNATFNAESIHDAPAPVLDSGSNSNSLTGNGNDLDVGGTGVGTGANGHPSAFTVVASTPEPASFGLLSFAALGLLARRRRTA